MSEIVTFPSNGSKAQGYLATPPAGGASPGVIVVQEWWGLNQQMKGVADRLADAGFVALAPDLFHGELAGHDEMDKAAELMSSLPADRAARDMSGAVDYLVGRRDTTDKVGVVGFCMGGMLAFLLAANRGDVIAAAVPFYGFPSGDGEPDWSAMTARVSAHVADPDDFFPAEAARGLADRLQAMGKEIELHVHEAGHGFMNEENPLGNHQPELAERCWNETIDFLAESLV